MSSSNDETRRNAGAGDDGEQQPPIGIPQDPEPIDAQEARALSPDDFDEEALAAAADRAEEAAECTGLGRGVHDCAAFQEVLSGLLALHTELVRTDRDDPEHEALDLAVDSFWDALENVTDGLAELRIAEDRARGRRDFSAELLQ